MTHGHRVGKPFPGPSGAASRSAGGGKAQFERWAVGAGHPVARPRGPNSHGDLARQDELGRRRVQFHDGQSTGLHDECRPGADSFLDHVAQRTEVVFASPAVPAHPPAVLDAVDDDAAETLLRQFRSLSLRERPTGRHIVPHPDAARWSDVVRRRGPGSTAADPHSGGRLKVAAAVHDGGGRPELALVTARFGNRSGPAHTVDHDSSSAR